MILFPVDVVKTHMQTRGVDLRTIFRSFRGPVLRSLYRGISPAFVEQAINRSILFGAGSAIKQRLPPAWPELLGDAVGGASAALIKTALLHPLDTVKCRWQLGQPHARLHSLYNGFAPAATRSAVGMAIWLSTRNGCERRVNRHDATGLSLAEHPFWSQLVPLRHALCGFVSSVLTDMCTFPLDTMKKTLQASEGGTGAALSVPQMEHVERMVARLG